MPSPVKSAASIAVSCGLLASKGTIFCTSCVNPVPNDDVRH
jgi:hypothetical protein